MHDITYKKADATLRKAGFKRISCTGSHWRYENDDGKSVILPRKVNPCIWRRLCKENNLYATKGE